MLWALPRPETAVLTLFLTTKCCLKLRCPTISVDSYDRKVAQDHPKRRWSTFSRSVRESVEWPAEDRARNEETVKKDKQDDEKALPDARCVDSIRLWRTATLRSEIERFPGKMETSLTSTTYHQSRGRKGKQTKLLVIGASRKRTLFWPHSI